MSDSDDTDALLSCDPTGGLNTLLGRTMDDVSSQRSQEVGAEGGEEAPQGSGYGGGAAGKDTKAGIKGNKNKEASLDISDFFNSEGELVLSGLSQFSESSTASVSVSERSVDGNQDSNVNNNKPGNDNEIRGRGNGNESPGPSDDGTGTPCTVESNTVVPNPSTSSSSKKKDDDGDRLTRKISNNEHEQGGSSSKGSKSNLEVVKVDKKSVPREVQEDLKRQIVEANRTNPEIQDWLGSSSSPISYGVLNLNLNDLKTFAEGLSRCDFFPKTEKVSTFVPTRNDKGEQVFSRAPNFRSPGGYKPPKEPRKCRELTQEQIREEVRKMYAYPDADDDDDVNVEDKGKEVRVRRDEAKSEAEVKDKNSDGNEQLSAPKNAQKPPVQFNFLSDASISSEFEFGKGKSGKPIKRKLLPSGGGICGGTVGSIPDLGFGLRNIGSEEVKEPTIERTKAWVTTTEANPIPTDSAVTVNDMNKSSGTDAEKGIQKSGFSFGYGDEENLLSPIKPADGHGSSRVNSTLLQSMRVLTTSSDSSTDGPIDGNKIPGGLDSSNPASSTSTDAIIREEKRTLKELPIPMLSSFQKQVTPKRRPIKKAASKLKGMMMASPRYSDKKDNPGETVPLARDLEKILSEIELPADEIESLIENLDEDDMDLAKVQFFEDEADDGNLTDVFSQLKLDAWRTTAESENLAEKYHNEKFKRDQCEKELRSLQESFLTEKQHTAVLEGTLKRRNLMLVQITMAFNRVCNEWTKFDSENRAAVTKLERDQKILASACKRSRDRISQYEKELHKTLELADSFKSKLVDVQTERDTSVTVLKEANNELEDKIKKLREDMESLKTERDATLRALRESQIKLDEGKHAVENMESHIKALELKDLENAHKFDELLHAKSLQESNYLEVVERRNELETLVMNLTSELNLEKSLKDKLKTGFQQEADRKSRAEAERLHGYYNNKVQEILKSATEEAARAEAVLKEQMKRAAMESDRKLADCKERYQKELEIVRMRYEAEIEKLKRENLHRQLLISSTVKQLQLGESPNLDVNCLTVQSRIPQLSRHKNDILEALKEQSQSSSEGGENFFKSGSSAPGVSQLTKFTLDHIPSIISTHSQLMSSKGNYGAFKEHVPFEATGNLSRFKTSTPIDSHSGMSSQCHGHGTGDAVGTGDLRKVPNAQYTNEDPSSLNSDKVRSDKSVNANNFSSTPYSLDLKNVLSHLLEAPVKPEKEQQQMNSHFNPGKLSEAPLDPTLQRCIQDLLKCYADKVQDTRPSDKDKDSISSSTMNNKNDYVKLNKNVGSVSNTDNHNNDDDDSEAQNSLNCNSTSESQAASHLQSHNSYCTSSSSKAEFRRSKSSKRDTNCTDEQSTGSGKPPWK